MDKIPHGARFYRAQKGWASSNERGHHYPYGPDRMKPQERRASEGRANSVGIPVLYLATSPETAVSETRPWVGAQVSVGTFEVTRDLTIVNFTHEGPTGAFRKLGLDGIFGERKPSTEQITDAVLADIDDAFSRPVSREDSSAADYAPTQILTELFKDAGYDGIAYNSHFKGGHNVALFDVEAARLRVCAPYEVKEVQIAIKQVDAELYYEN
nr:RES family NAD+ phosphorylase [Ensifer sp. ENS09]